MKKQITSTTMRFERERQNYLRDLAKLKVKYAVIFQDIAKEVVSEQTTAANR